MTTLYIDPGLLCIVIGQTPGGGVAKALYMVVAQTTIRSRLRQGLSLSETLADVNRQLYDLDSKQSLCALVGTLNTADGRLSYVNAGQQQPLLMRNEERYEWMEAPVYAALGLNQNVSYRTMELRLKQGDRLFLYTSGLGDLTDREGVPFRDQAFRTALNRSRSKAREPGEILRYAGLRNPMNHPTVMYRKSAVLDSGGYRDAPLHEDYDLWVRMLRRGEQMCNLPRILCYMRVDGGMYARRGGLRYWRVISRFHWELCRTRFCTRSQCAVSIAAYTVSCLVPACVRRRLYQRVLRKR